MTNNQKPDEFDRIDSKRNNNKKPPEDTGFDYGNREANHNNWERNPFDDVDERDNALERSQGLEL